MTTTEIIALAVSIVSGLVGLTTLFYVYCNPQAETTRRGRKNSPRRREP